MIGTKQSWCMRHCVLLPLLPSSSHLSSTLLGITWPKAASATTRLQSFMKLLQAKYWIFEHSVKYYCSTKFNARIYVLCTRFFVFCMCMFFIFTNDKGFIYIYSLKASVVVGWFQDDILDQTKKFRQMFVLLLQVNKFIQKFLVNKKTDNRKIKSFKETNHLLWFN